MAITLVNTETAEKVECSGLWAENNGDAVVYGFENTVNHQAYNLKPCPLEFQGYDEWPWNHKDDNFTATVHKVVGPWRVEIKD